MSGKLDQSLDDILSARRANAHRGRGRGRRVPIARSAPTGGVKKAVKAPNKPTTKAAPSAVPTGGQDTKIIVSNLVSKLV
jgi:THO complex subunit 4